MPTGSARRHKARERGFTYLLLLFALAIGGIGLAALGEQARQRALREQEAELQFRGAEIAAAIASYVDADPSGNRQLPRDVSDLLEDRRSGRIVRHLRQWRPEPLGGTWVLLGPGEGGCAAGAPPSRTAVGVSGVRSDSVRPLLRRDGDAPKRACDRVFHHQAYRTTAGAARTAIAVSP